MSRYAKQDTMLMEWMAKTKTGITLAKALDALGITDQLTQRHLSKRLSLLESRGYIECSRFGSVRTCTVLKEFPEKLSRRVDSPLLSREKKQVAYTGQPIKAENSEEFIRKGGVVERLKTNWDEPCKGSLALKGQSFYEQFDPVE